MSASRCDELARRRLRKRAARAIELEQVFLEFELVLEELLSDNTDHALPSLNDSPSRYAATPSTRLDTPGPIRAFPD